MRIPWSKPYRAFPELDRFSDDECERYVLQVRAQRLGSRWLPPAGLLLTVPASMYAIVYASLDIGEWVRDFDVWLFRMIRGTWPPVEVGPGEFLVWIGLGLLVVGGPALLYMIPRDALLRRAIANRLRLARCPKCRQSLVGLPVRALPEAYGGGPGVTCPECGTEHVLAKIGLTSDDIRVDRDQHG